MKIPKIFKLGDIEWQVIQEKSVGGNFGTTHQWHGTIAINSDLKKDIKEQTFCHELVHSILFSMGKPTDQHDEQFVDGFAVFLHQFLNTAK